ncbi:MAG TPA: hypothetical protein PLV21_07885 [Cyclobacteriaceae bacterium]|nr:hypothetical protein [Cyclobacteriaceae bacterium]HRJ81786.1 hypothetical protein [Cyclobacteriaceae bacterium]
MQRLFILLSWLSILLLSACYYDKEGILYPETANCVPTASPSFLNEVLPLLNGRCNNCHGGNSPSANIRLDAYAEVVIYANNGSLMGSINHSGGYSPMPKNSGKMSACEIQKIQNWISAGKLNN